MAGKARVHELAKELGVTSKAILTRLSEEGEVVKSASSTVEAPVARRLREFFGADQNARSLAAMQEPTYIYIRDRTSTAAHHWDYLNDRSDQALCGHGYVDPITLEEVPRPSAVCGACQARLPEYHAQWWRDQLQAANVQLEELRLKCRKLEERSDNQRKQLSTLPRKMHEAKQNKQTKSTSTTVTKKSRPRKAAVPPKRGTSLGIPVGKRRMVNDVPKRAADPSVVRKRLAELNAPRRPKTAAEKIADQIASDKMRSQKPSSWRLGRSPSSYG
jgi:hypothetical protein